MKLILGVLVVLLSFSSAMAQDTIQPNQEGLDLGDIKIGGHFKKLRDPSKLRFGVTISPMFTWLRQKTDLVDRGKVRGGVDYGGIVEYFFTPNIGISTGLSVLYDGGNLVYKDSVLNSQLFHKDATPVNALFKLQYLTIPVLVKLKTNQMGYFTYYGEAGFLTGFCVEAKVNAAQGNDVIYDDQNFLRRNNTTVYRSTIMDLSLQVGGGFEYALNDRSSLLIGLAYNNGLINVVKEPDNKFITINNFVLKVGILF